MPSRTSKAYSSDHLIREDGTVAFVCSTDEAVWPWLALPPHHPVPIQTQNYWTSVECSAVLGGFERDKWSALVWTDWESGKGDPGHAVRGIFANRATGQERGFTTELYDAKDQLVVRMRGRGVVFRTRNFKKWRSRAKAEAVRSRPIDRFVYAESAKLGLGEEEVPFLSVISEGRALALITRDNGFMPGNRYIGGSGDHVNSTHIAEVSRQFLNQVSGKRPARLTGGEMTLSRYIELGVPFFIETLDRSSDAIDLRLGQLERPCAKVTLRFVTT